MCKLSETRIASLTEAALKWIAEHPGCSREQAAKFVTAGLTFESRTRKSRYQLEVQVRLRRIENAQAVTSWVERQPKGDQPITVKDLRIDSPTIGIAKVVCRYAEALGRDWWENAPLDIARQVKRGLALAETPDEIRRRVDSFMRDALRHERETNAPRD